VLGAILLDESDPNTDRIGIWPRIAATLTPDDFYVGAFREVFAAFQRLTVAGTPIDPTTLSADLRTQGVFNALRNEGGVQALLDALTAPANVDTHARIVADHAARRRTAVIANALLQRTANLREPLAASIAGASVDLAAVRVPGIVASTITADLDVLWRTIEERSKSTSPLDASTGIAALDNALGGGIRPQLIVLGALPGVGKTTLAGQIALRIAATRGPVYFASLEMSRADVASSLMSCESGVELASIRYPMKLSEYDMQSLANAANRVNALDLRIVDSETPGVPRTVADIVAAVHALSQRPELVVVDHLGELQPRGRYREEREKIQEIMRDLAAAKRMLGIPFLILAHIGRAVAQGAAYRKPRPSDLFGGSGVEKTADVVMLLHREDLHPTTTGKKGDDPPEPGIVEVFVPKIRGAAPGFARLRFDGARQRFHDATRGAEHARAQTPATHATASAPPRDDVEGLPDAEDPGPLYDTTDYGRRWGDTR
jgi:replicative DNA helicase